MRMEYDALGGVKVPVDAYWGVHTARALANFPFSGGRLPGPFIRALAQVKRACTEANAGLGYLDRERAEAIATACREMEAGELHDQIVVDPFQGGAGTSTNMNVNEVLAGRGAEIMGGERADRELVHPLRHVNLHQSTNDVYPTALRVACLALLEELEEAVAALQEALQTKEAEFRDVVKVARTELVDAVPMTLSMNFGAWAEAVSRDRWRIFKSRERIKRVNLGGTAVGTGLGAPREYALAVAGHLRRITGLPVSRAENLVDGTQNLDPLVEVSGMLKAHASVLLKIASDLRLLASGPDAGLGEITLPPLQAGSSIMAGKINPVLPEAVSQIALRVMGNDLTVGLAAGLGQLELNHLMPLVTLAMLESLTLLIGADKGLAERCVTGIEPCRERCAAHVAASTALATALVPVLGYSRVEALVHAARAAGRSVREQALAEGVADAATLDRLLSPNQLCKLGYTPDDHQGVNVE